MLKPNIALKTHLQWVLGVSAQRIHRLMVCSCVQSLKMKKGSDSVCHKPLRVKKRPLGFIWIEGGRWESRGEESRVG